MKKEYFMEEAYKQAKIAEKLGEVPIGAVIVFKDKIIAKGYNKREKTKNALNHAEMIVINKACKKLKSWRLDECEIYATLEPCLMCYGAILNARIKKLYFGAFDNKTLIDKSILSSKNNSLNHNLLVEGGILEEKCSDILKRFFKKSR